MAILTRADIDRLPGMLGALGQYPVGLALVPPEPVPAPFTEQWRSTVGGRSVTISGPMSTELEPELRLSLMVTEPVPSESSPSNVARTLAVKLEYRQITFLIGPSLNPESVRATAVQGQRLAADVWFVPRGAGPGSLDAATLALVSPRVAIIPLDSGLRGAGPDVNGAIEVTTDGEGVRVRPERS